MPDLRNGRHAAWSVVALIVLVVGLAAWVAGYGGWPLVVAALAVGVLIAGRRLGLPAAIALTVIWSLGWWTLVGEVVLMGPASDTAWQWVLGFSAAGPVAVGFVLHALVPADVPRTSVSWRHAAAALVGPVAFLIAVGIALRRFGMDGLGWAMSGDARNTIQSAREMFPTVIGGQGITIDPTIALYSLLAVIGSRPGGGGSEPVVFDQAIVTLAATVAIAVVLMCLSSAALLVQAVGDRRVPVAAVVGASVAPLLGIGIGVGLQDGFVSALMAIVIVTSSLVVAALALAPDCDPRVRLIALASLVVAMGLLLFTWAYASVAVLPLLVAVVVYAWRGWDRAPRAIVMVGGALTLAALLSFMPRWIDHTITNNVFGMTGTIVAPTVWLLLIIVAALAVPVLLLREDCGRPFLIAALAAALAVTAFVTLIIYQPPGPPGYPYYAGKLTWVWSAAVLGLAFLPVVYAVDGRADAERTGTARGGRAGLCGVLLVLMVLMGLRFASSLDSPVLATQPIPPAAFSQIARGWTNPSAAAVSAARQAAQTPNVVVWDINDPGNDRLSNFWLDLIPSNRGGDLKGWAYLTSGELPSLCDLLSRDPTRTVVTLNPDLEGDIRRTCGIAQPNVRVLG